jgi:hypothetical protein
LLNIHRDHIIDAIARIWGAHAWSCRKGCGRAGGGGLWFDNRANCHCNASNTSITDPTKRLTSMQAHDFNETHQPVVN